MSEQKGLGSKIKRLFLEESGDGEAAASAAEEVARLAAQAAPQAAPVDPASPAAAPPSPAAPSSPAAATAPVEAAKLDFGVIYTGIAADDLAQVERAEQLLRTLPANLPLETQKQILETTLKTFGVDPQRIQKSLQRQQHALATYAAVVKQDADKRDAEARVRIESLRADALKLERAIEERARTRAGVELACRNKSEAVARTSQYLPAPAGREEAK